MREATIHDWSGRPDPGGPVTCARCGCRLGEVPGLEGVAWRHFRIRPDSDARGCRPECLEELHSQAGLALGPGSFEALAAAP